MHFRISSLKFSIFFSFIFCFWFSFFYPCCIGFPRFVVVVVEFTRRILVFILVLRFKYLRWDKNSIASEIFFRIFNKIPAPSLSFLSFLFRLLLLIYFEKQIKMVCGGFVWSFSDLHEKNKICMLSIYRINPFYEV